jgi:hypothetical protein
MSKDRLTHVDNVEVVATDLRALLFWATIGVNGAVDGQYSEEIEAIILSYSESLHLHGGRAKFRTVTR